MRRPELERAVKAAINEVLDPCSIGRGVPAGLVDMGMLCALEFDELSPCRVNARVTVRITSPGCTFGLYFANQIHARLKQLPELASIEICWSNRFDWSDDDMSDELKERLLLKRAKVLERARSAGVSLPVLVEGS